MGPHGNRMNTTGETNVSAQDDSDEQQEVIEVQILPQVCTFKTFFLAFLSKTYFRVSRFTNVGMFCDKKVSHST